MINIETVYNKWLAVTRTQRNKPFRLRKDFSNIDQEDFYPYLFKLTDFFKRHPHLFTDEFFIAPFKLLFPCDKGYYSLKFYASQKGLVTCSKYHEEMDLQDAENQVAQVKKSYEFIGKFCLKHNMQLNEYPFFKTGSYPDFLIHLKDHLISHYVIFSFPSLYVQMISMNEDDKNIFFGEDYKLSTYKKKFDSSTLLRNKSSEYFTKLTAVLRERLQKKLA